MLQIQRMAEAVKINGVSIYSQEDSKDGKYQYEGSARKSFRAEELFWMAFATNHPFVFSPENPMPLDLIEGVEIPYEEFDSPFKVFSIEVAGQFLTVARQGDIAKVNISCVMVTQGLIREGTNHNFLFVLYEVEGEPYVFCEIASNLKGELGRATLVAFPDFDPGKDWKVLPNNVFTQLIKSFADRLNKTSTVGIEKTNINIHYRGKHDKRMKTSIKQVVHIVSKSSRASVKPLVSKEIEWTHRFWRRGTWVNFYKEDGSIDFSKIGKDRDGNYNVPGKTWRIESLINADREDLPIVNKTRIVTE